MDLSSAYLFWARSDDKNLTERVRNVCVANLSETVGEAHASPVVRTLRHMPRGAEVVLFPPVPPWSLAYGSLRPKKGFEPARLSLAVLVFQG